MRPLKVSLKTSLRFVFGFQSWGYRWLHGLDFQMPRDNGAWEILH